MRWPVVLLALGLTSSCVPHIDARDAGTNHDDGRADPTDSSTGVDDGDDAGPASILDGGERFPACPPILPATADCATPVEGDEPFGVVLEGTAPFVMQVGDLTDYCFILTEASVSVAAYFPEGRGTGRPVVFTVDARSGGLTVVERTLDEGSGVTDVRLDGWPGSYFRDETRIAGSLIGPSDGFVALVHRNFQESLFSLNPMWAWAEMRLCPSDETVPGSLLSRPPFDDQPIGPLAYFRLHSTVPVRDDGGLVVVRDALTQEIVPVEVSIGEYIEVVPSQPLAMGASLIIETSAHDLIGRPLSLAGSELSVLATTSVVVDVSFDTQPPAGSMAGEVQWCSTGKLALGGTCSWAGFIGTETVVSSLVAFDVPPGATHLRARLQRERCTGTSTKYVWLRDSGERQDFSVACNNAWIDVETAIPSGEGRLNLAYFFDPGPTPPLLDAPHYDIGETFLDEVSFFGDADAGGG